jgi:hypothetical protein
MRNVILAVLAGLLVGCGTTTAYWDRPGANLTQVVSESEACYRAALDDDSPSALATAESSMRLLPRSEPPPALWKRAPRQAGFGRFDEQQRYERCMRQRGWVAVGSASIPR